MGTVIKFYGIYVYVNTDKIPVRDSNPHIMLPPLRLKDDIPKRSVLILP